MGPVQNLAKGGQTWQFQTKPGYSQPTSGNIDASTANDRALIPVS
jgi:hypothetical protein